MPLLPEYLSQTVLYVAPPTSTDWWAVAVGGFFTLFGAGAGALLGGIIAYKSSLRAGLQLSNQAKIEEAIAYTNRIEQFRVKCLDRCNSALKRDYYDLASRSLPVEQTEHACGIAEHLRALLEIHADNLSDDALLITSALNSIVTLSKELENVTNTGGVLHKEAYKDTASHFNKQLRCLCANTKKALVSKSMHKN